MLILILLISVSLAETVPLTFKTPMNWIKSESQNGSQVVLKDGNSVIRIDIFYVDNNTWNNFKPLYWNKSSLEYINAEKAVEMYKNYTNLIVINFYQRELVLVLLLLMECKL